jgi:hypothetical protein
VRGGALKISRGKLLGGLTGLFTFKSWLVFGFVFNINVN